ncbi:hypothetical protein ACRAWD_02170 [Caulobacter segnis]
MRAGGADPTSLTCRLLITAPGLSSQDVAGRIDGFPRRPHPQGPRYGKGVYFRLTGKAPFQRLIYPPPIHGALGTHYRNDLGGQAVFGPDLEYVPAPDYSVDPARAAAFAAYIRKFWPGLPDRRPAARLRRRAAQAARPRRAPAGLPAARGRGSRPHRPDGPVRHREPRPDQFPARSGEEVAARLLP